MSIHSSSISSLPLARTLAEQGFAVLPSYISDAACQSLIDRSRRLVDQFEPRDSRTVFETAGERARQDDHYFLESGDKIRFFWEAAALGLDGIPTKPKHGGINKIGHALHALDPVYKAFSHAPAVAQLCDDLGLTSPQICQSMHIFKNPWIGGEVGWHQDQTFVATLPDPVVGLWIALEDASTTNGCLWAIPGGHKRGLKQRLTRSGDQTTMAELDPQPWVSEGAVPLPVPRGSVVVLHGLLPHMSKANSSPDSRHAYTLHVMDGRSTFAPDNWMRPLLTAVH